MTKKCGVCRCDCKNYEVFTKKCYEDRKNKTQDPIYDDKKWYEFCWNNELCKWCYHDKQDHYEHKSI